ncbi:PD-(D/E)XK nuclease family protein [Polyangium sp. 15x6]|uniref:PD-(D/E)XK nuclease family protein n=1 Tax=Polyangium sp. 15x6 TaxID=3042687 RepID=UPI00249B5AA9|nr:PD-(D/E)XK nuclease family protein [Polyangium sp. 15x6]MDI3290704.1 PD-(D/E)XK nuclease family protein [Polyangium sp. 15x6]
MKASLAELRRQPHTSIAQLRMFLHCPRQYRLKYIDRVQPSFRPIAMVFGAIWHETVDKYLLGAGPEEMRELFRGGLEAAVKASAPPVLFNEDEDLGQMNDLGVRMIGVFVERVPRPKRVLGVEVDFLLELADPSTGEMLPVPLVGAIDAVVSTSGRKAVWEFKTAARKWSAPMLQYDLQPTAYAMAARKVFGKVQVVLIVATKTKKPDIQIEQLSRGKGDERDLAATAASALRGIKAGVDHPVRGSQCVSCPFAWKCR